MIDGFIRVAAATPEVHVADCSKNAENIINYIKEAHKNDASLIVFPELSITGYTCEDLFFQKTLIDNAQKALFEICEKTKDCDIVSVVGLPIKDNVSLYNCAVVICKGEILGIVPKTHIPNYNEHYEIRHFADGEQGVTNTYINNTCFTVRNDMIFACKEFSEFRFGVEICEDLWVADTPSVKLAQSGANIILNLSAGIEIVGKADYRRKLVEMQSSKLICAYAYANCGFGESTTDLVFSGHNLIFENGTLISEAKRFTTGIIYGDIDLQKIEGERRKINTFPADKSNCLVVPFSIKPKTLKLNREIKQLPFVPTSKGELDSRCSEILMITATGLATRLKHTNINTAILGLSGGLDSTLALCTTVRAFDMLNIPRKNIYAVTMPCFGTTKRTKSNAQSLAEVYGVTSMEVDITNSVLQHFDDIDHDKNNLDVTFENSQARERTQVLMDLANKYNGLVIGTGDLSELALGFATYNGDHMSMYGVNSSIPKTLIRYLVKYEADNSSDDLKNVLYDILDTPVSPELLPPSDGEISQKTEEIVGPYELHDFFLFYFVRYGFTPLKILRLAKIAFNGIYDETIIKKWLKIFTRRFFTQQFKRSCLPDGPKVGTVGLSPRSDFRMPSDATGVEWIKQLD